MGDANVEVLEAMYDAFGRGDVPAVLAGMTDDVEWHEAENMPYGPSPVHGPQAVAENVFAPLIGDIPDFTVTPEEFIGSGDTIAVVTRYGGTGKATGKELDMPVIHVFDFRDGKVARFRQFADGRTFTEVARAEAAATA
jgi:uncharacterized protein